MTTISGQHSRGSLTLVALCFTAVIAVALASYLMVCYRSLDLSFRDLHRSRARILAEIGLEEALWSLNQKPAQWTSPAWTTVGTAMTRTFTGYNLGQSATGQITVTVANYTGNTPTITSVGTVSLPAGGIFIKTLVATTKPAPLFGNAIAVSAGTVNFSRGGTVDSYDSRLGPYGGSNISAAAILAGTNVIITNATIQGYAATYGTALSRSAGLVKSLTGTSHDANRLSQSAFIPLFTVNTPLAINNYTGTVTGGSQTIGTAGGPTEYWYTSPWWGWPVDLNLSSGDTLQINGPVKLIVTQDLILSSSGKIQINANGRLEIFVANNVDITGTGGIINNSTSNLPKNLALFSTGMARSFTFRPSGAGAVFRGVIYSAETNAAINFTSNNPTFYGAILAQFDVNFSTPSPILHYDVALQNLSRDWFTDIATPFIINQQTEY